MPLHATTFSSQCGVERAQVGCLPVLDHPGQEAKQPAMEWVKEMVGIKTPANIQEIIVGQDRAKKRLLNEQVVRRQLRAAICGRTVEHVLHRILRCEPCACRGGSL
jgi:hypothetical protein